jgi:hypothetical protein
MATINYSFRYDKKLTKPSFEDETKEIEYLSTAEFYEAKCDYVLRKKFPTTSKIILRVVYIFSEMMILLILLL